MTLWGSACSWTRYATATRFSVFCTRVGALCRGVSRITSLFRNSTFTSRFIRRSSDLVASPLKYRFARGICTAAQSTALPRTGSTKPLRPAAKRSRIPRRALPSAGICRGFASFLTGRRTRRIPMNFSSRCATRWPRMKCTCLRPRAMLSHSRRGRLPSISRTRSTRRSATAR